MSKECKLCSGSRHVFNKERGGWVICECLKKKRRIESYETAGVSTRYDNETWRTFTETHEVKNKRSLLKVIKQLGAGEQPDRWVLIHGYPSRARALASTLILRTACDGELEARGIDVSGMIDAEFGDDRGAALLKLDALVIEVGGEPPNKWNRHVLEKVLKRRWAKNLFTVLIAEIEPGRVGTHYKSKQIEDDLSEKFIRVKLAPKGDS